MEQVRNCTKLPHTVIDRILKAVMNELLNEKRNLYEIKNDGSSSHWNRGGTLSVESLANKINKELLQELKKECKGLQTLLKNHHYIFEVKKGFVQFRSPESMLDISNNLLKSDNSSKWKNRKCWFHDNHPDKCPLTDDMCSYDHTFIRE